MSVPVTPHPCHQHLNSIFIIAILVSMKWYLLVVLICISLMTSDVEYLSMRFLVICISSLGKCLFKSFAHFLIGLFFVVVLVDEIAFFFAGM